MKKIAVILIAVLMVIGLAACGGTDSSGSDAGSSAGSSSSAEGSSAEGSSASSGGSEVLVVYFSQTGNTKGVAEKIAEIEGADIYEIEAADEYESEDLNYDDPESRATVEQNDPSVRPEIGSDPVSLDGNIIFVKAFARRVLLSNPQWHQFL